MNRAIALLAATLAIFFAAGCERRPPEPKVVACVGDSITEGWMGETPWPIYFAESLGEGFAVQNFGVIGATVNRGGDLPYPAQPQFQDALTCRPDIVVLILGTNDGKPHNWVSADAFAEEYRWLLGQFQALNPVPEIWVCTPPPVLGDGRYDISPQLVNGQVAGIVRERIAPLADGRLIDLAAAAPPPTSYQDEVHPNSQGGEAN